MPACSSLLPGSQLSVRSPSPASWSKAGLQPQTPRHLWPHPWGWLASLWFYSSGRSHSHSPSPGSCHTQGLPLEPSMAPQCSQRRRLGLHQKPCLAWHLHASPLPSTRPLPRPHCCHRPSHPRSSGLSLLELSHQVLPLYICCSLFSAALPFSSALSFQPKRLIHHSFIHSFIHPSLFISRG